MYIKECHSYIVHSSIIMSCSCCQFKKLFKVKTPSRIKTISSKLLTISPETAGLPQSKNFFLLILLIKSSSVKSWILILYFWQQYNALEQITELAGPLHKPNLITVLTGAQLLDKHV